MAVGFVNSCLYCSSARKRSIESTWWGCRSGESWGSDIPGESGANSPRCEGALGRELSTVLQVDERLGLRPPPLFRDGCSGLTKTASFAPLSAHLSCMAKTFTPPPSNEWRLSFRWRWTAASCQEMLTLLCGAVCSKSKVRTLSSAPDRKNALLMCFSFMLILCPI